MRVLKSASSRPTGRNIERAVADKQEPVLWLRYENGPVRLAMLEGDSASMSAEQTHGFWQEAYVRQRQALLPGNQPEGQACRGDSDLGDHGKRLRAFYSELVWAFEALPEASKQALRQGEDRFTFMLLSGVARLDLPRLISGFEQREFLNRILAMEEEAPPAEGLKPLKAITSRDQRLLLRIGHAWTVDQQDFEKQLRDISRLSAKYGREFFSELTSQLRRACVYIRDQGDRAGWRALRALVAAAAEDCPASWQDEREGLTALSSPRFLYPGERSA